MAWIKVIYPRSNSLCCLAPMSYSLIAALAENHLIGVNNRLPWHLPADLQHFKSLTLGKPMLMGRRTHESIGRPLPQRENIVLSHNPALQLPGCRVIQGLEQLSDYADQEIMVIGGAQLYQLLLPQAQRLYLTWVSGDFQGDTYFPALEPASWQEIASESHPADALNPYAYRFTTWARVARGPAELNHHA